jgi:hypothetical protein
MRSEESRSMNRRSLLKSGLLVGVGAATVGAGSVAAARTASAATPPTQVTINGKTYNVQEGWRYCVDCRSMIWSSSGSPAGECPSGGPHVPGSSTYGLPHDGASQGNAGNPGTLGVQIGWRWCGLCEALFWGSAVASTLCPWKVDNFVTSNQNHNLSSKTVYDMMFGGWVSSGVTLQSGWNYCTSCKGLFWGQGKDAGICEVSTIGFHTVASSNVTNYQVIISQ